MLGICKNINSQDSNFENAVESKQLLGISCAAFFYFIIIIIIISIFFFFFFFFDNNSLITPSPFWIDRFIN